MKKFFTSFLASVMVLTMFAPLTVGAAEVEVCGVDGVTYSSASSAEEAGVDVSYDFACTNPSSEEGLYEEKNDIRFAGMLIEIGSTDLPTTIIVRDNKTSMDYTVEVDEQTILGQQRGQETSLTDWIPGDQIKVTGLKNENTDTIDAAVLVNASIKMNQNKAANGWITAIDKDKKIITYQWANKEHVMEYSDDTRFVVGGINPASVDDLEVNDRIRARMLIRRCITEPCNPEAKIIVVLRRGEDLFMKIRTFRPNAELVRLDSTIVPTTIQVKMLETPGIKEGDVNNLIGTEGTLITINITEDTKLVRKYFGKTLLEEFSIGDKLQIVGRVNDDGTVDAKLLKNNSIWQTALKAHAGVVTEVNTDENYLMVNWTPIKHATKKKLKARLSGDSVSVEAQMMEINAISTEGSARVSIDNDGVRVDARRDNKKGSVREKVMLKLKNFKEEKVGEIKRKLKAKKVKIERISHEGVTLSDLVKRMPEKKMKVEITNDTKIVVAGDKEATINEIAEGDKVRVRGIRHASLPLITAEAIVVVAALPEVEESLEVEIDEVNGTVEVIIEEDVDEEMDETETEEYIDESSASSEQEDDGSEDVNEEEEEDENEEEEDDFSASSGQEDDGSEDINEEDEDEEESEDEEEYDDEEDDDEDEDMVDNEEDSSADSL